MKYGVLIARAQPPHDGHLDLINKSLYDVDHLIILLGSSNQCRSIKNPLSYNERKKLLINALGVKRYNVTILPLNDYKYNDSQWIFDVKTTVSTVTSNPVILFGHMKEGNDYLRLFPDWAFKHVDATHDINSTRIREEMLRTRNVLIPKSVLDDYDYYEKEKNLFKDYPFPDTLNFNCADVVLVCQGKVLLVERKFAPGKGLLALPGGFRQNNETFLDCAIRELKEESNVRVPEKVLRGSIVTSRMFDDPSRSFGVPRNTMAFLIEIQPEPSGKPPRSNGASDATRTEWRDIADVLNKSILFEDHADIISTLTGAKAVPAVFLQ